ncbi:hypothetical protein [Nonomuraea zeae]|uniref:CU044_5270 family protein n=1 Tax=Nonomuraea zeae TaxID=1642303 RepID=A0A5S4GFW2_9ACTN|nr:hypothetical protein [Nonomuraea zeae]TMR25070.1 hypothetical protein ETD85_45810 [Nonomuraea zeae]
MDEMERVRELFGPSRPDPRARARVWRRMAARRRRRRLSWLAVPVMAAALAVAFVAYQPPASPPQQVSARSLLLSAATTAAAGPAAEGTYWHVKKLRDGARTIELWATRDGRAWTAEDGRVTRVKGRSPFSMAGRDLTFEQIEGLPTEPAALRARVAAMLPQDSPGLLADALSGLLWNKPSPPAVRAAAFRALADLPEVRYLGESLPGEAFSYVLPDGSQRTIIIDPATSQVLSSTDGRPSERTERVLAAGWTDKGPDLR